MKITEKWKSVKRRTKIIFISVLIVGVLCVIVGISAFLFLRKGSGMGELPQMNGYQNGMVM